MLCGNARLSDWQHRTVRLSLTLGTGILARCLLPSKPEVLLAGFYPNTHNLKNSQNCLQSKKNDSDIKLITAFLDNTVSVSLVCLEILCL